MSRNYRVTLAVSIALLVCMLLSLTVAASPPAPGDRPSAQPPVDIQVGKPSATQKPIDQPNIKDYQRNQERMRLLEAGKTAEAAALAQTGTDRILVILVEFAGTDMVTWTQACRNGTRSAGPIPTKPSTMPSGNVVVGDCSNIITQTKTFTYAGPVHNQIPRPLSAADRSGQSIWTENFSKRLVQGLHVRERRQVRLHPRRRLEGE